MLLVEVPLKRGVVHLQKEGPWECIANWATGEGGVVSLTAEWSIGGRGSITYRREKTSMPSPRGWHLNSRHPGSLSTSSH